VRVDGDDSPSVDRDSDPVEIAYRRTLDQLAVGVEQFSMGGSHEDFLYWTPPQRLAREVLGTVEEPLDPMAATIQKHADTLDPVTRDSLGKRFDSEDLAWLPRKIDDERST
jgi:hypothetical protein